MSNREYSVKPQIKTGAATVAKYRQRVQEASHPFVGTVLIEEKRERFIAAVHQALPQDVPEFAVRESLNYLAGSGLTLDEANTLSWRLAGNIHRLRNGNAVQPWSHQLVSEWALMQIVRHETIPRRDNSLANKFSFRIISGLPASFVATAVWSRNLCYYHAKDFGFTASWKNHPLVHPAQYVGMRCLGYVTPDACQVGKPGFKEVAVTSTLRAFNRNLILMRDRDLLGFSCPIKAQHPCHKCPVGYDRCPAGTHPKSYVKRYCECCNNDSWFDPGTYSQSCVRCAYKELFK